MTAQTVQPGPQSSPGTDTARRVSVEVTLDYEVPEGADIMLRIGAGRHQGQRVLQHGYTSETALAIREAPSSTVWARAQGQFRCTYRAEVEVDRSAAELASLPAVPVQELPDEVLRYMVASRYCPSDEFASFVTSEFAETTGGARVQAIADWVAEHLTYAAGVSNAHTTALDTFVARQGVCRDFAHLVITLVRASCIPARIASVYGATVTPPDFHAVAEVYLDGNWHLVDATGMAGPEGLVKICDGRDAADIAFMTIYGGAVNLTEQVVSVTADS
ncbi:transglutaminase-like domain-containing protein [Seohaeicola zhoushanensis]|uniref:Transglutaminase-like domain-containing protein n=1 Tax=Seohaeicola zhoushanensis TaxID=1569283 RepID=A0A8J3GTE9_9RHOB|nr:transglutaminase family protein [Seohaeicola zhoushanensis]GHF33061.1 hypothetical protein GCM10017056_00560 [Seohaeicola zhoushanensis]